MASSQKAHHTDSLSLATRYSLLRGRHLSMEKYWNERHCADKRYIEELENRNATLLEMLQIAQNEIDDLKKRILSNDTEKKIKNEKDLSFSMETDLKMEYKNLFNIKLNKSIERENLFYELLRECLFLSDPYNIRVLLKRSKSNNNNNCLSLQSSLSNILKLRKQSDFECDCFAIHYIWNIKNISSYSTRLILMRNSLIICGVGISSNYYQQRQEEKEWNTLKNIEIELYTIAGIYICNNDPFSYCNSMIIASSKDLTVAAHGINPLNVLLNQTNDNIICYQFNIFSDCKKLIHSLTERLPDYVWHINNNNNNNIDTSSQSPLLLINRNNNNLNNLNNNDCKRHHIDIASSSSSSMVGRLGAGLVAGITGVVMDPIRGGQNDGMKGFLRGIASGISGVAIKPITHFRDNNDMEGKDNNNDDEDGKHDMNDNNINNQNNNDNDNDNDIHIHCDKDDVNNIDIDRKQDIRSALIIPDSPLIPHAECLSESGSIASSTFTTNTMDSSKSGHSSNISNINISNNNDNNNQNNNNKTLLQSQIFSRHKSMQRQQYILDKKHNNNINMNNNKNTKSNINDKK